MSKSEQPRKKWKHRVTACFYPEYGPRKYRFNVDESKSALTAKVEAEYFHFGLRQWRPVENWNTLERLYKIAKPFHGETSTPEAA